MRDGFLKIGLLPAILILIMIAFEPPGVSLPSLTAAVIHECGHLFAARLLKIELRSLDIGPLGATIRTRGSLISYGCEWLLCAAGPAANLASGAAAYMIFHGSKRFTPGGTAFGFCSVSLMLALLNLLPVEGFDGGRMLLRRCRGVWRDRAPHAVCSPSARSSHFADCGCSPSICCSDGGRLCRFSYFRHRCSAVFSLNPTNTAAYKSTR